MILFIDFTDQVLESRYKGCMTGTVFLDLCKAFHTVDHLLFINKLLHIWLMKHQLLCLKTSWFFWLKKLWLLRLKKPWLFWSKKLRLFWFKKLQLLRQKKPRLFRLKKPRLLRLKKVQLLRLKKLCLDRLKFWLFWLKKRCCSD